MKIILVRHAQTLKNKEGKMQGHEDSDLTEEGREQVLKIVKRLSHENVSGVYCSGLGRALKTADKISESHGLKTKIDRRLNELNWGDFSSAPVKEVILKWSNYYGEMKKKGVPREEIRPPKGENSFDHAGRVKGFIDELEKKHTNDTVVIVGHSGTNKVFIGILRGIDPEKFYEIEQDNACINYIELDEKGNIIKSEINVTAHLKN
jgi:probable phosphoglycerate mutase